MPQPHTSHQIQDCHPSLQAISLVDSQRGFLWHKEIQVYENLELKNSRVCRKYTLYLPRVWTLPVYSNEYFRQSCSPIIATYNKSILIANIQKAANPASHAK